MEFYENSRYLNRVRPISLELNLSRSVEFVFQYIDYREDGYEKQ